MRLLGTSLLLLALALPAPGSAATVTGAGHVARFEAAPGEVNDVVARAKGGAVVVVDRGAPLVAGAGCAKQASGAVRCPGTSSFDAALGDGDDRAGAFVDGANTVVRGGPGADRLRTRDSATLSGEDGADVLVAVSIPGLGGTGSALFGGAGRDRLTGSDDDDALSGDGLPPADAVGPPRSAPAAADVLDGGGGRDLVDYGGAPLGVRIDLRRTRQGPRGEGDVLRRVEEVFGGEGADVLTGTRRRDTLFGAGGRDRISGLGGGDELGGEVVRGGAGDDVLHAEGDGGRTSVGCGRGDDRAAAELFGAARSCERVFVDADPSVNAGRTVHRRDGRLVVRYADDLEGQQVTLLQGSRRLGRATVGARGRLVVRPSAADYGRLRRGARLTLVVPGGWDELGELPDVALPLVVAR